jgi:hypothetical protein
MGSIHFVEGAVWACFVGSWLALRISFSRSPLEEFALAPQCIVSVCAALAATAVRYKEGMLRTLFHLCFGSWLSQAYFIAELMLTERFRKGTLENQGLAVVSLGLSLALSTVQTLIAGSGLKETRWREGTWALCTVVCTSSVQSAPWNGGLLNVLWSIVAVSTNLCSICLKPFQMRAIPQEYSAGGLSANQILDITSVALQATSAAVSLAAAYLNERNSWLLPAFLGAPLALQAYWAATGYDAVPRPSAPSRDQLEQAEAEEDHEPERQAQAVPAASSQARAIPQAARVVQLPKMTPPAQQPAVRPIPYIRPPSDYFPVMPMPGQSSPTNPIRHDTDNLKASVKCFRDAILFGKTRPAVAKCKKSA